jgi:glycosyltransferase involved in cell wall biosynthesis
VRPTRFTTLFPGAEDCHLTKDVGMIPLVLGRYFGYDSRLATHANGDYPSLRGLDGLQLERIPRRTGDAALDALDWVGANAGRIDVLQVYHWLPHVLRWLDAYLTANPRGRALLKLDANRSLAGADCWSRFSPAEQDVLRRCHLVSVESRELHEHLSAHWPIPVAYVPNGFYDGGRRVDVDFAMKEDVILTVGRLGTFQKATDVLLAAYAKAFPLIRGWRLRLVGRVEPGFEGFVETFFAAHPSLREHVTFTGPIGDRARLAEEYRRAKVFCLPSRWEGFGLVLPEALSAGCRLICSDTPAAPDLTDQGRLGDVFPVDDVDALVTCLLRACTDGDDSAARCAEAQEFAYEHFYWPHIAGTIHRLLRGGEDSELPPVVADLGAAR